MNSTAIKILACFIMLLDHIGAILIPGNMLLRIVGRVAMPLFAYQIAVSLKKTKNKRKFVTRLLIFAFASQLIYAYVFNTYTLNILFNFVLVSAVIMIFENNKLLGVLAGVSYLLIFNEKVVDYGSLILALCLLFYYAANKLQIGLVYTALSIFTVNSIQCFSILALPLILLHNGKKGIGYKYQYFFYWFYPAHMLALKLLSLFYH